MVKRANSQKKEQKEKKTMGNIRIKTEEKIQSLEEVKELRQSNVKHYKLKNGKYRAEVYAEPVHYYDDESKEYKDIDNTLKENGEWYENTSNNVKVKFGKNSNNEKMFVLEKGEYKVEWKLLGKKSKKAGNENRGSKAQLGNEKKANEKRRVVIKYEDVSENTDVEYEVKSDRIKENC